MNYVYVIYEFLYILSMIQAHKLLEPYIFNISFF